MTVEKLPTRLRQHSSSSTSTAAVDGSSSWWNEGICYKGCVSMFSWRFNSNECGFSNLRCELYTFTRSFATLALTYANREQSGFVRYYFSIYLQREMKPAHGKRILSTSFIHQTNRLESILVFWTVINTISLTRKLAFSKCFFSANAKNGHDTAAIKEARFLCPFSLYDTCQKKQDTSRLTHWHWPWIIDDTCHKQSLRPVSHNRWPHFRLLFTYRHCGSIKRILILVVFLAPARGGSFRHTFVRH